VTKIYDSIFIFALPSRPPKKKEVKSSASIHHQPNVCCAFLYFSFLIHILFFSMMKELFEAARKISGNYFGEDVWV
jgi:hypothetical protein